MAADEIQPQARLQPAKQRVRLTKWALVAATAASFGAATTLLARAGDSGTTATPTGASAVPTVANDEQAQESSDDFFGGGSIAPQDDFGSVSSQPRVGTRSS